MKKSILLVTVLSVALSSVPAMAENPAPFHAMSQLSTGRTETAEGSAVDSMTDEQLAGVEGGIVFLAVLTPALVGKVLGAIGSLAMLADIYANGENAWAPSALADAACNVTNCNVP